MDNSGEGQRQGQDPLESTQECQEIRISSNHLLSRKGTEGAGEKEIRCGC